MRAPRINWTLLLGLGLFCGALSVLASEDEGDVDRILERSEWFLSRRRLPDGTVGSALRLKAAAELRAQREQTKANGTLGGAAWTSIGPNPTRSGTSIVSGRVVSLAVDPRDSNVVYAGSATGGVWKTLDGGGSW